MPAVSSTNADIALESVSFAYGDELVIKDVSLKIRGGEYVAIIGPNGAGKTTLLKLMLGALSAAKGGIEIFGTPIRQFADWPRIGYVPQKATHIDAAFPATVREVVMMGRYAPRGLLRRTNAEDGKLVEEALKQVGMLDLQHRLIGDLSGGQQQRVFIARALATQPRLIVLDEPTIGVDRTTKDDLYALLRSLNRERNMTLVMVSHDIDTMMREASHIAYIDTQLEFYGTSEEFKQSGILERNVSLLTHHHSI